MHNIKRGLNPDGSDPIMAQLDELAPRFPPSSLFVDGLEWQWIDTAAAGPPVILLPGSAADAFMFVRTLTSVGSRLRLISMTVPALWEPDALARGLKAVIDHLQLPASVLVGSSFGAYWGPFVALHYPKQVRALLIGNGFVDASDLSANPLFDREYIEAVSPEQMKTEWEARIDAAPASELRDLQRFMLARKSPASLHAHFLAVVRARACPPIALAESKITVLDCDDDPVIPKAARERLRARYPGARHVTLAHGGHYPHVLNSTAYADLLSSIAS